MQTMQIDNTMFDFLSTDSFALTYRGSVLPSLARVGQKNVGIDSSRFGPLGFTRGGLSQGNYDGFEQKHELNTLKDIDDFSSHPHISFTRVLQAPQPFTLRKSLLGKHYGHLHLQFCQILRKIRYDGLSLMNPRQDSSKETPHDAANGFKETKQGRFNIKELEIIFYFSPFEGTGEVATARASRWSTRMRQ